MTNKIENMKIKQNKSKSNQKDSVVKRGSLLKLLVPVLLGLIAIVILVVLGINRFQFRYYVDEEGFAIPNDLSLSNLNATTNENTSLYKVKLGEAVYTLKDSKDDYYVGDAKDNINGGFPLFTRNGQVLYFLGSDTPIITNEFDYVDSYAGLRLSDGITFNPSSEADLDEMILVDVPYGYQLAQKTTIDSISNSITIPMNTICNFTENKIDCYEYNDGILESYSIAVYSENTIAIGDNEYNYQDFLSKLGLWKSRTVISNDAPEKEMEPADKATSNRTNKRGSSNAPLPPSDVFDTPEGAKANNNEPGPGAKKPLPEREPYFPPEVIINTEQIEEKVYNIQIPVEVIDRSSKIKGKGVQLLAYRIKTNPDGSFVIGEDGEYVYSTPEETRVAVSSMIDGPQLARVGQLEPGYSYVIYYAYTYFNERGFEVPVKEKIGDYFTTLGYDSLNPVKLNLDDANVEIYGDRFQINDIYYSREGISNGITALPGDRNVSNATIHDLDCAESYISIVSVEYIKYTGIFNNGNVAYDEFPENHLNYNFNSLQLDLMKKGFTMDYWNSPLVSSASKFAYRVVLKDKYGHVFNYTDSNDNAPKVHFAKTCATAPSVSITVPASSNKPGSVVTNVVWKNIDNCDIINGPNLYFTTSEDCSKATAIPLQAYKLDEDGNRVGGLIEANCLPIEYSENGVETKYEIVNLKSLTIYNAYVICDKFDDFSDVDRIDVLLNKVFKFKCASLTSYGLIKYSGTTSDVTSSTATLYPRLVYNRNESLYENELLDFVQYIDIKTYPSENKNKATIIRIYKNDLSAIDLGDFSDPTLDPNDKAYLNDVVVPVYVVQGNVEKKLFANFNFLYKTTMPTLNGVEPTNVWDYILATSSVSQEASFYFEISQFLRDEEGTPVQRMVSIESNTPYVTELIFEATIEGTDVYENVTASSSTPIKFTTTRAEPVVYFADILTSKEFVELYAFHITDDEHCISPNQSGKNTNARIVVYEYDKESDTVGRVVQTYYIDSSLYYDTIRINGLNENTDYCFKVIANEYQNSGVYNNFELNISCGIGTDGRVICEKKVPFFTEALVYGDIEITSLSRIYKDKDGNEKGYVGLINNVVVENENQDGWTYDSDTGIYKSNLVKVDGNASLSLFTGYKSSSISYLPNYYEAVDYIQSSGSEYIKTGYFHNRNTEIDVVLQPIRTNSVFNVIFGSRTDSGDLNGDTFNFGFHDGQNTFYSDIPNAHWTGLGEVGSSFAATYYKMDGRLNIQDWSIFHTLKVSNNGMDVDNYGNVAYFTEAESFGGASLGDAAFEDYIFARNTNNTAMEKASMRLKSFKISEDGVLLMDLVPVITVKEVPAYLVNTGVKAKIGTVGLYDTVSEMLFVNSGTGAFSCPASNTVSDYSETLSTYKLEQLDYIETGEQQAINTRYLHNSNTVVDAIFIPDNDATNTTNALFGARTFSLSEDDYWLGFNKDTKYYHVESGTNSNDKLVLNDFNNYSNIHATVSSVTINGKTIATGTTSIKPSAFNDYIFAVNDNGVAKEHGKYKLKTLKISENGVYVRNYIPVVVKENTTLTTSVGSIVTENDSITAGTVGLFDLVDNVLYLDIAGKTFAVPEVSANEQITGVLANKLKVVKSISSSSIGGQFIDTGLKSTNGYRAEVKFSYGNGSGCNHIIGGADVSGSGRNALSGTAGWHNSYLRIDNGVLHIGFQNADRYNEPIVSGKVYDVAFSIADVDKVNDPYGDGYVKFKDANGVYQQVWAAANEWYNMDLNRAHNSDVVNGPIAIWAYTSPAWNGTDYNTGVGNYAKSLSIYHAKIIQLDANKNEVAVREFIPVVTTDVIDAQFVNTHKTIMAGTAGLYEINEGKFYANSGKGSFQFDEYTTESLTATNNTGIFTIKVFDKDKNLVEEYTNDLLANGNIFNIDANEDFNLNDEDDYGYVQVEVKPTSDKFSISNVYLESFDRDELSENLVDLSKNGSLINGYAYDEEGSQVEFDGYSVVAEFTSVLPDSVYYVSGLDYYSSYTTREGTSTLLEISNSSKSSSQVVNFYNAGKEFIGSAYVGGQGALFKTPSNAAYVRFSMRSQQEVASTAPVQDSGSAIQNIGDFDYDAVHNVSNAVAQKAGVSFNKVDNNGYIDDDNYVYTILDYIKADGNQWIDTNYKPTNKTRWILDYQIDTQKNASGAWNVGFGTGPSGNANMFGASYSSAYNLNFVIKTNKNTPYNIESSRHIYDFDAKNGKVTLDGNIVVTQYNAGELNSYVASDYSSLTFFAIKDSAYSFSQRHAGKLYSSQIYEDDVLVRDYIPVRRAFKTTAADAEQRIDYGLYDLVTNTFLGATCSTDLIGSTHFTGNIYDNKYKEIDYIQSSGSQYIDTGYYFKDNTKIVYDFEISGWNWNWGALFGARQYNHSTDTVSVCQNGSNGNLRTEMGASNFAWSNALSLNTRYELTLTKSVMQTGSYSENVRCTTSACGAINYPGDYSIWLLTINNFGAIDTQWGTLPQKLYKCQIYEDTTLKMDFVPVFSTEDFEYGLYDTVSHKFFRSGATRVSLTGGSNASMNYDYTKVAYIEATGSQYIATGYVPTADTKMVVDYMPTSIEGNQAIAGVLWNANAFLLNIQSNVYKYHSSGNVLIDAIINERHKFAYTKSEVSIDDGERRVSASDTLANAKQQIKLFGCNESTTSNVTSYFAKGRMYGAQIYNGSSLVRDFVPVRRNSDGALGFYDTVENMFYENKGTGDFATSALANSDILVGVKYTVDSQSYKFTRKGSPFEYSFIPEFGGKYKITSSNIVSGDPYIYIYEEGNDVPLASDDDSGDGNNFNLTYELEGGKRYIIKPTTSNLVFKNEFKYDFIVSDVNYGYDYSSFKLQLYDAINQDEFNGTYDGFIEQIVNANYPNGYVTGGNIVVRLYRTNETIKYNADLDSYNNWVDVQQDPILNETIKTIGGVPQQHIDFNKNIRIAANYGYKLSLFVKKPDTGIEVLIDNVTFIATQSMYVIKDIPTLKAVADDLAGYYICVSDLPAESDGDNVIDFTVSDDLFTGVIDWQGHSVELSSSNYLFNKLGNNAILKNGDFIYSGDSATYDDTLKYIDEFGNIAVEDPGTGLVKLDYIEAKDGAYIVTRVKQSDKINYEIVFERTGRPNIAQQLIGYTSANEDASIMLQSDTSSAVAKTYNSRTAQLFDLKPDKKSTYKLVGNVFSVNDGEEHSVPVIRDGFTGTENITILASDTDGRNKAYGRLYSVVISEELDVKFNGIPAMTTKDIVGNIHSKDNQTIPSGTIGLYDTVSKKFYASYYPFEFSSLPYNDDTTIAKNLIDKMLPDGASDDSYLTNDVPDIPISSGFINGSGVEDASKYQKVVDADGNPLVIPDKFARIEYLQSDGTARINTGYTFNGGTIYADYEFFNDKSSSVAVIYGAQNVQNGQYRTSLHSYLGAIEMAVDQVYGYHYNSSDAIPQYGRHETLMSTVATAGKTTWYTYNYDGATKVSQKTLNSGSNRPIYNIHLFGFGMGEDHLRVRDYNGRLLPTRIYSFYIKDASNVLQRYYLPVIAMEDIPASEVDSGIVAKAGTLGMYDVVTKKFYIDFYATPGTKYHGSSTFTGGVASINYSNSNATITQNTACIAKYNYGTLSNMILHYGPVSKSTYAVDDYSAGFVVYNYGTIDRFALQYTRDINVKSNVSGVALYNYGTISNGYVCGAKKEDGDGVYGLVHRYTTVDSLIGVRQKVGGENKTSYIYHVSDAQTNAGYLSYITSYNYNEGVVDGVYVVDDLKIESADANNGAYGSWTIITNPLTEKLSRVDYIEATGDQFITTGYVPNETTEIEVEWQSSDKSTTQNIFGASNSSNINAMLLGIQGGYYYFGGYGDGHSNTWANTSVAPSTSEKDIIHYGTKLGQLSINGNFNGPEWKVETYGKYQDCHGNPGPITENPKQYPELREVNSPDYWNGLTPDVKYASDRELYDYTHDGRTNYSRKLTTYAYSTKAFTKNITLTFDDYGFVQMNGNMISGPYPILWNYNYDSKTTKSIPFQFKEGWNEIIIGYNQNYGAARVQFSTLLSSLPEITKRSAFNPEATTDDVNNIIDDRSSVDSTLGIFSSGNGTSGSYAKGKLYELKIWEDVNGVKTLVHDFVPCTATENIEGEYTYNGKPILRGTGCLYDIVDRVIYANNGSGNFATPWQFDNTALDTDFSALITGYNEGTVTNSFTSGDIYDVKYDRENNGEGIVPKTSVVMRRIGPAIGSMYSSFNNKNVNYITLASTQYLNNQASYMSNVNNYTETYSLYDGKWYESMLGVDGDRFDISSSVSSNMYPRLILSDYFSAAQIPTATLPSAQSTIRLLGTETRFFGKDKAGNQVALVTLLASNPGSNKVHIDGINIVDSQGTPLKTEVVAQGYDSDNYRIDVLITYSENASSGSVPLAENSYLVTTYAVAGAGGVMNNYRFNNDGDIYVEAPFYRIIGSTSDWNQKLGRLNQGDKNENYRLVNDIDFSGSLTYNDWLVYSNLRGSLDGGIYSEEEVILKDYANNNIKTENGADRTIFIEKDLVGMHKISGIGNVDVDGKLNSMRGMNDSNSSVYDFTDINSARSSLFCQVSGKLSNLVFEKFITRYSEDFPALSEYDLTKAVGGVIARAMSGAVIENCHVRNSEIATREYGGALVAYASNAIIENCSAKDVTVTGYDNPACENSTYLGGLVGYAYNSQITNSFVSNATISSTTVNNLLGAGGIAGVVDSTSIYACYAGNGLVYSNGNCVGGIVGKVGPNSVLTKNEFGKSTSIENCWSTIAVQGSGDYIGGIAGYMGIYNGKEVKTNANVLANNYTSSSLISTNYGAANVNRINSFSYENKGYYYNNYAYINQILNYKDNSSEVFEKIYQFGPSDELNGAVRLLDANAIHDPSTWVNEILFSEDSFDMSAVEQGLMPKLFNSKTGELLYDQPNERLAVNTGASLKVFDDGSQDHGISINSSEEIITAKFALFFDGDGWSKDRLLEYANKEVEDWVDVANWDYMSCVGANVLAANSAKIFKFNPISPYVIEENGKVGLVFEARFDYGDEKLGHYADSYLVTLPVYLNMPEFSPRISTSVYALIALTEDKIPTYNILDSDDWNEFFRADGPHYNTPENVRLFADGNYIFSEGKNNAYNANIQKLFVSPGASGEDTVKFRGKVSYNEENTTGANSVSFISNINQLNNVSFEDFDVYYNDISNENPQGIIGQVNGTVEDVSFKNVNVLGMNSHSTGLIGVVSAGSNLSNITLENVVVENNVNTLETYGFGGLVGAVLGSSSKQVNISGITAYELDVNTKNGTNSNVGGLFGKAEYANISNVSLGNHKPDASEDAVPNGFIELEYISSGDEGSGNAASIDTGVYTNLNTRVELDFAPTCLEAGVNDIPVLGVRTSSTSDKKFALLINGTSGRFITAFGPLADGPMSSIKAINLGGKYHVTLDAAKGITVKDEAGNDFAKAEGSLEQAHLPANSSKIYLLGVNNPNASVEGSYQRLYSAQIYDGDELLRDFVPAMANADISNFKVYKNGSTQTTSIPKGTVGLYEKNTNTFYESHVSNVSFGKGPSVKKAYNHIEGKKYVGGIAGIINNTSIDNIDLNSVAINSVEGYTGGLIGGGNNYTLTGLNNANYINVNSYGDYVGGLIPSIDNSTQNISGLLYDESNTGVRTISDVYLYGDQRIGTVVGSISNSLVLLNNVQFDNIEVVARSGKDGGTTSTSAGGIFGYLNANEIATFTGIKLHNVNVHPHFASLDADFGVGGAIGDLTSTSAVTFNNCDISDITAKSGYNVGGVIGSYKDLSANIENVTFNNSSITNVNVNSYRYSSDLFTDSYAGGVVGYVHKGNLYFDNASTITNVTAKGASFVGGVVGGYGDDYAASEASPVVRYIGARDQVSSNTGTLVDNPRLVVDDVKLTVKFNIAGGVLGGTSQLHNFAAVSNVDIKNVDIHTEARLPQPNIQAGQRHVGQNYNGAIGGIAGNATFIRNCTVGDLDGVNDDERGANSSPKLNIHGNYIGNVGGAVGILGTSNNGLRYDSENIQVYNAKISFTGDNAKRIDYSGYNIGGIAGNLRNGNLFGESIDLSDDFNKVIVKNVTIDGKGLCGGIVGLFGDEANKSLGSYSTVHDCLGINNIVSSFDATANPSEVGGMFGSIIQSGSEVYNCKSIWSSVFGSSRVGGIVGSITPQTIDNVAPTSFHDCGIVDGTVFATNGEVGGIVGYVDSKNTSIYNCYAISEDNTINIQQSFNKLNPNSKNEFNNAFTDVNAALSLDDTKKGTYIISQPIHTGTGNYENSFANNSCGGIVGFFGGKEIHDCFVGDKVYILSYQDDDSVYSTTGGIAGYIRNNNEDEKFVELYDKLDYIESVDNAYIDTKLYSQDVWKVDVNASPKQGATGLGALFGAGIHNYQTTGLHVVLNGASSYFYCGGHVSFSYTFDDSNIYHVVATRFKNSTKLLTIGVGMDSIGSDVSSGSVGTVTNNLPFWLFGSYAAGEHRYASVRIHSAKIYDSSDKLLRDYVPARRRSDGTLGLYDLVNREFYENANPERDVNDYNGKFVTDNAKLFDKGASVADPYVGTNLIDVNILTNCVVSGSVQTLSQLSSTGDREATAGFVGYYKPGTINFNNYLDVDKMIIDVGSIYNSTLGPDPLSFENLLFNGNVIGRNNAEVGIGLIDAYLPSDSIKNSDPNHWDEDYYIKDASSHDSASLYWRYNQAGSQPDDFASYLVPKEERITIDYTADRDLLFAPTDKGYPVNMRNAGIGRLRITDNASVATKSSSANGAAIYGITNNYSDSLTPDTLTSYIECLAVSAADLGSNSNLYYGDASTGNMQLDYEFWHNFLDGAYTPPLTMLMSMPRSIINSDVQLLVDGMSVYASGVDTINLELPEVPYGEITYTINSPSYSISGLWPSGERTITLKYDFEGDLAISLTSGVNDASTVIDNCDITNSIMSYGDSYWYLHEGKVIDSHGRSTGDSVEYIHMFDGKLLDSNGNIYDATSGNKLSTAVGLSTSDIKPLWQANVNTADGTYAIKSFSQYSLSNDNVIEARVYVKNNSLVTLSAPSKMISGAIVDTYGENTYATVLLDDGKLLDLGKELNYPSGFKNDSIVEISNNVDYSGRIILVRYSNDKLVAFNYITGEEVSVQYNEPSLFESFGDFFANSLSNFSLKTSSSGPRGILQDASIYEKNVNNNPDYANALHQINKDGVKSSEATEESTIVTGESDIVDSIEIIDVDENIDTTIKEFNIENSYVALYNKDDDNSEIYDVSEVLSKPSEERVSEDEKASMLADLGIKSAMPAKENKAHSSMSGIALIGLIILALFSLIGVLFYIRKRNFPEEK